MHTASKEQHGGEGAGGIRKQDRSCVGVPRSRCQEKLGGTEDLGMETGSWRGRRRLCSVEETLESD